MILRSSKGQFRIPGHEDSSLLAGDMDELMKIIAPVINGIITEHPQPFCQLPERAISDELHCFFKKIALLHAPCVFLF